MSSREAQPREIRLPLESGGSSPSRGARPVALVAALLVGIIAALAAHALSLPVWAAGLSFVGALATVALFDRLVLRMGALTESRAWLSLDDAEIARVDDKGRTSLARWGEPFGLSVLANTEQSRALLVFTTPSATRFLGLRLESAKDADAARDLMVHGITVPDADLELAAGPAQDVRLGAPSARLLVEELTRRDPQAMQRIYLSDARGTPIALEAESLTVGDDTFDLTVAIDWRVFTFHEGDPGVLTLYQATAIRQGSNELCLVCRAPAELASWALGRAGDAPPSRDTRVAIDRLFMTPLRSALERAPRVSRAGQPPRSRRKTAQT